MKKKMKKLRCEYCGDVAVTRSFGDLLSCRLHAEQPGGTPIYDSDTGLPLRDPLELKEFLRKNRVRQMKAQSAGNAEIARALREHSATLPTVGVDRAGHHDCEAHRTSDRLAGDNSSTSPTGPQGGHP